MKPILLGSIVEAALKTKSEVVSGSDQREDDVVTVRLTVEQLTNLAALGYLFPLLSPSQKAIDTLFKKDKTDEITTDLKRLHGIPPFEGNPAAFDGLYAQSLTEKYGVTIGQLEKSVSFDKIIDRWNKVKATF
jgi:hypothetical protein